MLIRLVAWGKRTFFVRVECKVVPAVLRCTISISAGTACVIRFDYEK